MGSVASKTWAMAWVVKELRVEVLGLRPRAYKLMVFVLASFLATAGGVVYVLLLNSTNPFTQFTGAAATPSSAMVVNTDYKGTLTLQNTGSYRAAIVSLVVFFVVGLILLLKVNVRRAILAAGNTPPMSVR